MSSKTTPILITLLVIAAFLVGMFWTKIQYLEGTKGTEGTKVGQATPSPALPEQKILSAQEIADLALTGPVKGNPNAKITIVEFSDFQCPFCNQVQDTLKQVLTTYPTQVKVVFRNFPLPMHENAEAAAEAALCANEQGKFWEYHDKLFSNQDKLSVTDLKQYAVSLGLDTGKFNSCLDSKKYQGAVQKDTSAGQAVGVSGTPSFFINGKLIPGALPFDSFKQIIDEELTK